MKTLVAYVGGEEGFSFGRREIFAMSAFELIWWAECLNTRRRKK